MKKYIELIFHIALVILCGTCITYSENIVTTIIWIFNTVIWGICIGLDIAELI